MRILLLLLLLTIPGCETILAPRHVTFYHWTGQDWESGWGDDTFNGNDMIYVDHRFIVGF